MVASRAGWNFTSAFDPVVTYECRQVGQLLFMDVTAVTETPPNVATFGRPGVAVILIVSY